MENLDKKSLKKFGLTMAIAFLIIAVFILIRRGEVSLPVLIISVIFFITGKFSPLLLKPVYISWMKFASILAWLNTRLILIIVFYLVFTPIGFIMRLFGMDLLEERINKQSASYWKRKEPEKPSYERQF